MQEKKYTIWTKLQNIFGYYLGTVFENRRYKFTIIISWYTFKTDISYFQVSSSLCKISHMHQTQQYAVTMIYLDINIAGTIADWWLLIISEAVDEKLLKRLAHAIWELLSPECRAAVSSIKLWAWEGLEYFNTMPQALEKARFAAELFSSLATGNKSFSSIPVNGFISVPTFWTSKEIKLATPTLSRKWKFQKKSTSTIDYMKSNKMRQNSYTTLKAVRRVHWDSQHSWQMDEKEWNCIIYVKDRTPGQKWLIIWHLACCWFPTSKIYTVRFSVKISTVATIKGYTNKNTVLLRKKTLERGRQISKHSLLYLIRVS